MNKCGKCGAENKEQVKFCKACGSSLSMAETGLSGKKARITDQEATWKKPLAIAAAVVVVLGALWMAKGVYMSKKMGNRPMFSPLRDASARLSHAVAVKAEGGDVRIPLAAIEDGNAHFYAYASGGKTITFFIMKAADGTIRTAYDACMACNHAKLGYRQEKNLVACNNCGMGFNPADIGKETGGCNPIVLSKVVDGKTIVLKVKDLEAGAQYF